MKKNKGLKSAADASVQRKSKRTTTKAPEEPASESIDLVDGDVDPLACPEESTVEEVGYEFTHSIFTPDTVFRCEQCDRVFKDRKNLTRHRKTHSDLRPHKCDVCEKAFKRSDNKNKHMLQMHSQEKADKIKPKTKESLKPSLPNTKPLRKHVTSNPNKQHECEECGSSFARDEHLRRHRLIHTGERPHKCDLCDKAFSRIDHRNNHMRTHTGEKPFKCDVCEKSFSRSEHRLNHMFTIHPLDFKPEVTLDD